MPQGKEISFVVFPTGEIDEKSLTVSGEVFARQCFIQGWLPERLFGKSLESYSTVDAIWRGAQSKGFRSYTIKMDDDGKPRLADK